MNVGYVFGGFSVQGNRLTAFLYVFPYAGIFQGYFSIRFMLVASSSIITPIRGIISDSPKLVIVKKINRPAHDMIDR